MHPPRVKVCLQGLWVWEQHFEQTPRAFLWPLKPPGSVQGWREKIWYSKILHNGMVCCASPKRFSRVQHDLCFSQDEQLVPR